jgi:hypothetical protein
VTEAVVEHGLGIDVEDADERLGSRDERSRLAYRWQRIDATECVPFDRELSGQDDHGGNDKVRKWLQLLKNLLLFVDNITASTHNEESFQKWTVPNLGILASLKQTHFLCHKYQEQDNAHQRFERIGHKVQDAEAK